ncbi:hypothetical protein [Shewanella japonica]|uniref:Uncharacterized protein n=1 Tax=Shewanella japonica TaxID=93973 RepID=A0ABN4Y965_9GAMM|nr:hypothetical protein [Shewanella japonica]ARD20986.1 hypothetical protein SJ2017_0648 [Shewanella japonica]
MTKFSTVNNPLPRRLIILMAFYIFLSILALLRSYAIQGIDLFTIGVIPVLFGLVKRTHWASLVLKIYLAIQTLAMLALSTTAIIAYQITPEDVKVEFNGVSIPVPAIALSAVLILGYQYWVAFSQKTTQYLKPDC